MVAAIDAVAAYDRLTERGTRFLRLDEARAKCEAWRRDYNEVRPHSAIGNKTPMELHRMAASPAGRTSDDAGIF